MDVSLGGYHARLDALEGFDQHWLLITTRNGQKLWEGPFESYEAAESRQDNLLAPVSAILRGQLTRALTVTMSCPHEGTKHTTEWCGCTCPE